ncbi:outer membrane biogenesis protein BamB [Halolamina pelagica]|uniref:Outer membrane biogenesis protein BamB n=1 Tax=Halolamina pelagica TaxID=699431 RepID=A0A0P7G700_9EURY|nr:PQQ-binding-like beta-propeller repeat protein [Halolamina pelagica]KPN28974.1 outer membrane biogenesis protein BamB [Halolamina pelagica]
MNRFIERRDLLRGTGTAFGGMISGCLSAPKQKTTPYDYQPPPDGTWPQIGYDARNSRHVKTRGPLTGAEVKWRSGEASIYPPVISDDLYVAEAWTEGAVFAVGKAQGMRKWTNESLPSIRWAPALHNDQLLIISRNSSNIFQLHSINVEGGHLEWSRRDGISASTNYHPPAGPTVKGDTVYIASESGVIAHDAVTGEPQWEHILRRASPEALESGQLPNWAQPAVNDTIAITFDRNDESGKFREVYAIDRGTGDLTWVAELNLEENWRLKGYPVIGSGRVFVSAERSDVELQSSESSWTGSERLFAIDIKSGNTVWTEKLSGKTISPPAYAEGSLYIGEWYPEQGTSELYPLDIYNRDKKWRYKTESGAISSVTVCDEAVYFGLSNKTAAVNKENGELLWSLNVGEQVGPIIVLGNTAYIQTNPGHNNKSRLISIKEPE